MQSESTGPVVVGTDLSDSAAAAVEQAAEWADRHGTSLVVVHVAPESVFETLSVSKVEQAIYESIAASVPRSVRSEVRIVPGSPHAALVQVADERNASLVVVGASGKAGFGATLFGTTAEQVVRYAHCAVLVARPSPGKGPVIGATDFSENAMPALRAAVDEARRRAAEVIALHCIFQPASALSALGPLVVSPPSPTPAELSAQQQAARETLESVLAAAWEKAEPGKGRAVVTTLEPPSRAIVSLAGEAGASLIVVGTRGRTGLARVALGSVAEGVVRNAPCSVLAVRFK